MAYDVPPPVMAPGPVPTNNAFGSMPPPPAYNGGGLAPLIAQFLASQNMSNGPLWTPHVAPPVAPPAPVGNPLPATPGLPQLPPGHQFFGHLLARARAARLANQNPALVAAGGGLPGSVVPQVMPGAVPAAPAPAPAPAPMPMGGGAEGPSPSIMPSGGFMGAFDPAGGNPFLQRPSAPKGPGY